MKRIFGVVLFGALSLLVVMTGLSQKAGTAGGSSGQMANPPAEAASTPSLEASQGK